MSDCDKMTWLKLVFMSTVIVIYIVLLLVFLAISSLILRHAVKFSYLSHRFKYLVGIFAVIALSVIGFSVFLLFKMDGGSDRVPFDSPSVPAGDSSDSGSLNF